MDYIYRKVCKVKGNRGTFSISHLLLTSSDPLGLIVSGAFGYCFVSARALNGLGQTDKVQTPQLLSAGLCHFPADIEA